MKIVKVKDVELMENPYDLEAKVLLNNKNAHIIHITLRPEQSMLKHITAVDICYYILEGNGIAEVGNEKIEVGPDTLIEVPKGIPHRVNNIYNKPLKLLIEKLPNTDKPPIFV